LQTFFDLGKIPSVFDNDLSKIEMCQNNKNKVRNDIIKRLNFVSARIRDEEIYKNLLSIKDSVCDVTNSGK